MHCDMTNITVLYVCVCVRCRHGMENVCVEKMVSGVMLVSLPTVKLMLFA